MIEAATAELEVIEGKFVSVLVLFDRVSLSGLSLARLLGKRVLPGAGEEERLPSKGESSRGGK